MKDLFTKTFFRQANIFFLVVLGSFLVLALASLGENWPKAFVGALITAAFNSLGF